MYHLVMFMIGLRHTDTKKLNNNYYLDTKYFGKALFIAIYKKDTNKLIKKIYKNLDIAQDFTKAEDGLYYNKAWSKCGTKIDADGLGWTIEQIREYMLQYEVISELTDINKYESMIDNIRYVTA